MRFVTLFPNCGNVELVKDVGQIPWVLSKIHPEIEATLVSSKVDVKGEYTGMLSGLKIEKIPLIANEALTGLWYLLKNSRKIDWLNIYHSGRQSYVWNAVYKLLNPKGKSYLKLDLDFNSCTLFETNRKERKRFCRGIRDFDLVSVESEAIYKRIKKYLNREVVIIGNGFCKAGMFDGKPVVRENLFITAGRLGTVQKATDILLEGFAESATEHDWTLMLVGSVEEAFQRYIEQYFERYPQLKERIIFSGQIKDREKLYAMYRRAKVFVLPSRWEGYPLVVPEALSCGLKLIVSDSVPSAWEAVADDRFGCIVPAGDVHELARAFVNAVKWDYSESESESIERYANDTFSWENICEQLYKYMI